MPQGKLNLATEPTPLTKPAAVPRNEPPPASVVTTPVEEDTARMRLLPESDMKTVPPVDVEASPRGLLNLAAVVAPSAKPAVLEPPPPRTVVTAPLAGAYRRMTLLPTSAMATVPEAVTSAPEGTLNSAAAPISSLKPDVIERPPPTHEDTTATAGARDGEGEANGVKVREGVDVRVWCAEASGEGLGETTMRTR